MKPTLAILSQERGNTWMSTFKVAGTENWKEGDVHLISVKENNGYLNFEPAQETLESRVKKLEAAVFGASLKANVPPQPMNDMPPDDFNNF